MKGSGLVIDAKTVIEKALIDNNIKKKDFYKQVGYNTQQQLTNKLKANSFKLNEFEEWIDLLGLELKIVKKGE